MNIHTKLNNIKITVNPQYLQQKKGWMSGIEQFIYYHKNKLVFLHIAMFFLFLILILLPLWLPLPTEKATTFKNFTLFSQFLLWGIWFPLVFVSVIFSGRSWCGLLCPMGAASEWINKIGFQFKIPGWLKWEGTPILSFLFVTILGQTIDVRNQADAIAELFGGTFLFALFIGFLYGKNKRAWCRHVCPIGLLLGVFSRLGAIQFAPKHPRLGQDHYTEKGVCPTMIAISYKKESRHCIQCFRCVKPTSPGGLFVQLRKIGYEIINIRQHNANIYEVWFIFLGMGIALGGFLWLILPQYQFIREWIGTFFINQGWYWIGETGPRFLMSVHPLQRQSYNWLDFITIVGFMLSVMLMVTFFLSICTAISVYIAKGSKHFKKHFTELAYQFAPVAMISIIIGLGDKLFSECTLWGIHPIFLSVIKGLLLLLSIVWSIFLGNELLKKQNIFSSFRRRVALIPGIFGSFLIGLSWWPAIFGLHYSLLESYRHHLILLH